MADDLTLGAVGCGNLAKALIGRWLAAGTLPAARIAACTAHAESAEQVRASLGIACSLDLRTAAQAQVVLLAFKPQQRGDLLPQLAELAAERPETIWVSLLAGVPVAELEHRLGPQAKVVRWMPNTPVRLGLGAVAMCTGRQVDAADRQTALGLLEPLGQHYLLDEAAFDAFTAVAGCGPAYVFALCEALEHAAMAAQLPAAMATDLVRQTLIGAAALLQQSALTAGELRAQVTSKGGMTEAALARLQAGGWADLMTAAVAAAQQRARALADTKPS
ncbi:MAG: pyrroline-5-carboxylate reductase [Deltaproteobacteria bacterium]|nr:pyrroline-5-carboxylate reductase [Deltaproteobacteria bacterium]